MYRIKYIIFAIIVFMFAIVIAVIYQLSTIEIRQTKDYAEIYVDENDILDGNVMVYPPEKYAPLLQIDINMRKMVAEYMRKNSYKLKRGKQEFIRNNPSFKELIEDGFQFEKISRQGDS
ncbi:MAG: hypothetical protein V8S74_08505 [Lachnospirales bacterium]